VADDAAAEIERAHALLRDADNPARMALAMMAIAADHLELVGDARAAMAVLLAGRFRRPDSVDVMADD
jgi:hypothetical protein